MKRLCVFGLASVFAHNNDEADKLCVRPLSTLPGDNVPLLWSAHDDLRGRYLLLVQLVVARQLAHLDIVAAQTLPQKVK